MRLLLLNQAFYPDVASTGQHLADVALGLVERGHGVTVVTSRRAYDEPERQFPKFETWHGVRIYRVASTGLGKGAKWRRAADFASFLLSATMRLALLRRHDVVVALTSPPLISFLGAWVARLRGSAFVYWVMDFNPDEAIAAGWLRPHSLAARLLEWISRFSLRHASKVIALDRFMRERIVAKGIAPEKVIIIPPWSHDGEVAFDAAGRERFRREHGLDGKFVVMYSGNHSPCHPLDTLLAAAGQLASDPGHCVLLCWRRQRVAQDRRRAESRKQKAEGGREHRTSNIQHPTSNIQRPASGIRYPASSIKHPLSSLPAAGAVGGLALCCRPARRGYGRPVRWVGASVQDLQCPQRRGAGALHWPAAQPSL